MSKFKNSMGLSSDIEFQNMFPIRQLHRLVASYWPFAKKPFLIWYPIDPKNICLSAEIIFNKLFDGI